MSSLRRRAIWVTRARSIARSSTGGRASARTTAPASPGSTSSRSHASRSRTSARWKNAAAPDRWYGTARSSNATATAWPSARTERTSTHTSSGATSERATSRSTSAATACACARSEAQRQNATSPPSCAAVRSFSSRSSIGSTTARAAASTRPAQRCDTSSRITVASGHSARKSRTFLVAAPRKRWIAWSSSANAVIPPCSATSSRSSRPWAKLASCSSSTSTWRNRAGHPRADERALAQQPERLQDEVAEVERAGVLEQPVVGGEQRRELALAGAGGVLRAGPPPTPRSRRRRSARP